MNRDKLIEQGKLLLDINTLSEISFKYDEWKDNVLKYVGKENADYEECKVQLHIVNVPYGSNEEKIKKYYDCIKNGIRFLEKSSEYRIQYLENVTRNFGVYLKNMFFTIPDKKATIKESVLKEIVVNNEYDIQHIMYAVVKSLYPTARREVPQDTGYKGMRADIYIDEIDTIIEIKCTRKEHTENKLYRELAEDGYLYKCQNLIMYIYDKNSIIKDVDNFVKALERDRQTAGKNVKVYVEQAKELL